MIIREPLFKTAEGRYWILATSLHYYSALTHTLIVPAGFRTDLASIPRIFRGLIGVNGKHRLAAVVHDFLYSCKGRLPCGRVLTRKQCDKIFLELMEDAGVTWWRRKAMYRAVRLGGGFHF